MTPIELMGANRISMEDSSMNRAACRVLRTQIDALNDMIALLRNAKRITEFYGQRGQTARKSFRSIKP